MPTFSREESSVAPSCERRSLRSGNGPRPLADKHPTNHSHDVPRLRRLARSGARTDVLLRRGFRAAELPAVVAGRCRPAAPRGRRRGGGGGQVARQGKDGRVRPAEDRARVGQCAAGRDGDGLVGSGHHHRPRQRLRHPRRVRQGGRRTRRARRKIRDPGPHRRAHPSDDRRRGPQRRPRRQHVRVPDQGRRAGKDPQGARRDARRRHHRLCGLQPRHAVARPHLHHPRRPRRHLGQKTHRGHPQHVPFHHRQLSRFDYGGRHRDDGGLSRRRAFPAVPGRADERCRRGEPGRSLPEAHPRAVARGNVVDPVGHAVGSVCAEGSDDHLGSMGPSSTKLRAGTRRVRDGRSHRRPARPRGLPRPHAAGTPPARARRQPPLQRLDPGPTWRANVLPARRRKRLSALGRGDQDALGRVGAGQDGVRQRAVPRPARGQLRGPELPGAGDLGPAEGDEGGRVEPHGPRHRGQGAGRGHGRVREALGQGGGVPQGGRELEAAARARDGVEAGRVPAYEGTGGVSQLHVVVLLLARRILLQRSLRAQAPRTHGHLQVRRGRRPHLERALRHARRPHPAHPRLSSHGRPRYPLRRCLLPRAGRHPRAGPSRADHQRRRGAGRGGHHGVAGAGQVRRLCGAGPRPVRGADAGAGVPGGARDVARGEEEGVGLRSWLPSRNSTMI